jgi:SET domain-containing protein
MGGGAAGDLAAMSAAGSRPSGLVSWRPIDGKGRGVVAVRACPAGTEVERSPVIVVPQSDLLVRAGGRTVFDEYLLYWSDEPGREIAMGGGLLMFYNHSDRPNVEFHTGPEPETMSVIALRDLAAGEELTYDYEVELWFRPAPRDDADAG